MAGYLTASDLSAFYDARRVGELLSDSDVPLAVAQIDAAPVFILLSNAASAEVDAACQVGRRYTRGDFEKMISDAVSFPNDSAIVKRVGLLKQLVADLVYSRLLSRRGYSGDTLERLAPRAAAAEDMLRQLANGTRVFDLDANISAGVPSVVVIGSRRLTSGYYNNLFGFWPNSPSADPSGTLGHY